MMFGRSKKRTAKEKRKDIGKAGKKRTKDARKTGGKRARETNRSRPPAPRARESKTIKDAGPPLKIAGSAKTKPVTGTTPEEVVKRRQKP